MISQVADNLFIGNAEAANAVEHLQTLGITDVVFLHAPSPEWPDEFLTLHTYPFPDGERLEAESFTRITNVIASVRSSGRVLVACAAGISRSSTMVLAHLVREGMCLEDAYRHLLTSHPIADPHPKLWESLIDYIGVDVTWLDVMQWRIEGKQ